MPTNDDHDWDDEETTGVRTVDDISQSLSQTAHLVVLSGRSVGQLIPLEQRDMVIGRARDAEILLKDDGVSRQHAAITVLPNGSVRIRDLGSTNRTVVEGASLDEPRILADGDRIRVGPVILKFGYQDAVEQQFMSHLYASATRDWLTGAFNRRFFLEMLEREFAWHARNEEPLTLMFVDIDHLTAVNDTRGHDAGDAVLRLVCEMCTEACRLEDMVARYGGEEFAILLRRSSPESGLKVANRIREKVAADPLVVGEVEIPITVSVGIVTRKTDDLSRPERLVELAEAQLQLAKDNGRNRVETA